MTKRFSAQQQIALELLTLPKKGGMTYAQIAEKCEVDERTLYNWRQDDAFNNELNRRIVRSLSERLPEMIASVPDHVIADGNAALFRTALQALGLLTEKVEVDNKNGTIDVDAIRERLAKGNSE